MIAALAALIRSEPGMAERLLAVHTNDGTGRCRVCSPGGPARAGRYPWPCAIQMSAAEAQQRVVVDDRPVISGAP